MALYPDFVVFRAGISVRALGPELDISRFDLNDSVLHLGWCSGLVPAVQQEPELYGPAGPSMSSRLEEQTQQ